MFRTLFLIPILVAVFLVDASSAMAADGVGQIAYTKGDAWVMRGNERQEAEVGMNLLRNDEIVTGAGGRVKLFMEDGSNIYISPRSRLYLREYATKDKNLFAASMDVLWGKARFLINRLVAKDASFEVRTTTAVLGVRGTEFLVLAPPTPALLARQFDPVTLEALPKLPMRMVLINGLVDATTFLGVVYRITPGKTIDVDSTGKVTVRPSSKLDFDLSLRGEPLFPVAGTELLPPSLGGIGASGGEPSGQGRRRLAPSVLTLSTDISIINAMQNLGATSSVTLQPGFVVP